ncbi:uncharacterized protein LOC131146426 [Malania oleifera]|uniref:uncharacterized protein LOC131146426 n=1 Tax=Malania oleifera TaxID=397392 RepID=UPI0025AE8186|nr:uncharacterized protein LOC131146426 [Malania oleifera]XP_057952018.1 uncharacterized protein LOC131146426 [Malania oleifera]XP_057952019.1 uncharacterized protein LOC131146426 [Malania oleifera]
MMSMVGLELTNFINPNLTWKTVSKGSRSASRRSRKSVARNEKVSLEQADKSPEGVDTLVSESEKLGVAVLGRRFRDKVEHVPIKKRRFLFRSPSPPLRTSSPCLEESEQSVNSQHDLGQRSCQNSISEKQVVGIDAFTSMKCNNVVDGKIPEEMTKEKPGYSEDFSGIQILAAAACDDSMGDDVNVLEDDSLAEESPARGGNELSSTTPLKETVASSETTFTQDLAREDGFGGSFFQENSVPIKQNFSTLKDDTTEKKSVISRDDRSHWDLNTVMDAWEHPCADLAVDSQADVMDGFSGDATCAEYLQTLEACKIARDSGDDNQSNIQSTVGKVVLFDARAVHVCLDSRNSVFGTCKLDREEHNLAVCSDTDRTKVLDMYAPLSAELSLKSSAMPVSGTEASTHAVSMDACLDLSSHAGSDFVSSSLTFEEKENPLPSGVIRKHSSENSVSDMLLGNASSETDQAEKRDVAFPAAPVSEKITCASMDEVCEDSSRMSGLDGKRISPRLITDACQSPCPDPLDVENPSSESGEIMDVSPLSPMCMDVSASVAHVGEYRPTVTEDPSRHNTMDSGAVRNESDMSMNLGPNELLNKSSGHSSVILGERGELTSCEECKGHGNDPAISPGKMLDNEDGQGRTVGMENMVELQEGYDSQFEDGELRESVVHCWEDSEAEDGEAEPVDYETDDRDTYDDSIDYSVSFENSTRETNCQPCLGVPSPKIILDAELNKRWSKKTSNMHLGMESARKDGIEKLEMDVKVDTCYGTGSADVGDKNGLVNGVDALKEPNHSARLKSKFSGWDYRLPEGCVISSDKRFEINGNTRRSRANNCVNGPGDVKDISNRVNGMRESKSFSKLEGHSSSDFVHRKDTMHLQWNRSNQLDDSHPQADRAFNGSERSAGRMRTLHMHGRSHVGGHWDDHHSLGSWDSKRYDGPCDSRKPRPKSVIVNSDSKVEDSAPSDRALSKARVSEINCHLRGQSMHSSSKGVYRRFIRRRSPVARDYNYHLNMGIPVRDVSPDRTRCRPGRYPGFSPREGYYRPLPNGAAESFVRMPPHLARRERSFSPILHRGAPHFSRPHERYRSRSRSRSPLMRQLPRERNTGLRPLSRSPDFRSEVSMERVRLPVQKQPGFASDFEAGFVSPPRNRFSPQRNLRWIDDRNCGVDQFRERRSPVRIFRRGHRFSSPCSPGRLKPDNYFRPAMRSGRFPEMGCAGRGRKYDCNNDHRRKQGSRYNMIHPERHYDVTDGDGGGRRFRFDVGDSGFVGHDSRVKDECIKNTDRRHKDIPRRGREERDHS